MYMSPERFSREPEGPQPDIYSLGMTAIHLLTGGLPFTEETVTDVRDAIVNGMVPSRIGRLAAELPTGWRRYLEASCALRPQDRPDNYAKVRRLIEALET